MVRRPTLGLLLGLVCALFACLHAATASAEESAQTAPAGIATSGLCGLAYAEHPTCQAYLVGLSGTAGYGYTESFGPTDGAHHRGAGTLGVGVSPLPWLSASLRLDGRFDAHPPDAEGDDSTMVGDPRLAVRMGHALNSEFSVGGSLGLWFPGAEAPSFRLNASSVDLKALAAWNPQKMRPLTVLGNVGFRLDNSANAAPDLQRVRPGDRMSLGLSDAHAVLVAVGASYRVHPTAEVFLDVSADILVGSKAPSFTDSPLRISAGGRYFLSPALQLELLLTGSLSSRPSMRATAPLVPIEPRIMVSAGVRFGIPHKGPEAAASDLTPEDQTQANDEPQKPQIAKVTGVIHDDHEAPLPEAKVTLQIGDTVREQITDAEGRYTFPDTPLGSATLSVSAAGFVDESWEVEVTAGMAPLEARTLTPKADTGTLRCLTRTFGSEPLKANISIRNKRGKEIKKGVSDEQGRFEVELPPGSYQVIIQAPGYRTHRRNVKVATNGVAILNVDMRED